MKWLQRIESEYLLHKGCIDAIKESGIKYAIFCPAMMKSVGSRSTEVKVKVNRPSGDFVSYEDASVVMVDAAEKDKWDGECITAATMV